MSNTRTQNSFGQENKSFSYFEILKHLVLTTYAGSAQQIADRYLVRCQNESDIGERLQCLILSGNDQDVLELFLRGLKKKNISDIVIEHSNIGIHVNPINECLDIQNGALLAIILNYGANPNQEFWMSDDQGNKFLDLPPLLKAMIYQSKSEIRLLALYGAMMFENQIFEKILPIYRNIKIYPQYITFYNDVVMEIKKLRNLDACAQKLETAKEYIAAFASYLEIGNFYLNFALGCQNECKYEAAKKPLLLFYIRQSLFSYTRALFCIEMALAHADLYTDNLMKLKELLMKLHQAIFEISKPIREHNFLHIKVQPFVESWNRITQSLKEIPSDFGASVLAISQSDNKIKLNSNVIFEISKSIENLELLTADILIYEDPAKSMQSEIYSSDEDTDSENQSELHYRGMRNTSTKYINTSESNEDDESVTLLRFGK